MIKVCLSSSWIIHISDFNRLNEQKIQFAFEKCTALTTITANQDAMCAQI